jgi:hypothetical protein
MLINYLNKKFNSHHLIQLLKFTSKFTYLYSGLDNSITHYDQSSPHKFGFIGNHSFDSPHLLDSIQSR